MDTLDYNLVLTIHIISFIVNISLVVVSDFLGLLWVMGKREFLPARLMTVFHYIIWVGLSVSILTGFYLFYGVKDYLLTVPAFYTKIILVTALVINSFVIHKHMELVTSRSFKSIGKADRVKLVVSGFVSIVSWVGVFISAQFLGI